MSLYSWKNTHNVWRFDRSAKWGERLNDLKFVTFTDHFPRDGPASMAAKGFSFVFQCRFRYCCWCRRIHKVYFLMILLLWGLEVLILLLDEL